MQKRLGHAKISTTMDLYSHVMPSMQKDTFKRFSMVLEVGARRQVSTETAVKPKEEVPGWKPMANSCLEIGRG